MTGLPEGRVFNFSAGPCMMPYEVRRQCLVSAEVHAVGKAMFTELHSIRAIRGSSNSGVRRSSR